MNLGARTAAWSGEKLPYGYRHVKYLQSNGKQYINTGYLPNTTTSARARISRSGATGAYQVAFGSRIAYRNNQFAVWSYSDNRNGSFRYDVDSLDNFYTSFACNNGQVYDVTLTPNEATIDDDTVASFTIADYTSTIPLYLFAMNNNGSVHWYHMGKIYSVSLLEDDKAVREFVPVVRTRDNVGGMYDRLTKTFLVNIGTGTFGWEEMDGTVVSPT